MKEGRKAPRGATKGKGVNGGRWEGVDNIEVTRKDGIASEEF